MDGSARDRERAAAAERSVVRDLEQQIDELEARLRRTQAVIEARDGRIADLETTLVSLQTSYGWRLLQRFRTVRVWLAPPGTQRDSFFRSLLRALEIWRRLGFRAMVTRVLGRLRKGAWGGYAPVIAGADPYRAWIAENEPTAEELARQRAAAAALAYRPLFSIVTPVFDPPVEILRETIDSVLAQTYDHWELCLVDGHSKNRAVRAMLEAYARADSRLVVRFLDRNLGIAGNSNEALRLARGEFVTFLDHDDLLAPHALFEMARILNADPDLDLVYSDKDLVSEDGQQRFNPLFKPDWSPELMLSANYLAHLTVVRRGLVEQVGGFRPETDGAQDWDLFFRIVEATRKIAHAPKVLYHWRVSVGSCASGLEAKPYAREAQLHAVQAHLRRRRLPGVAVPDVGCVRIRWNVSEKTRICVIIPTKDQVAMLSRCVTSLLERTAYRNLEVVLVENGSVEAETFDFYRRIATDPRVRVVRFEAPFNYSAVCNFGARDAAGDAFLFLNNDTEVIDPDWLGELVGWIEQGEIGVVGCKLLGADGRIQHGGVAIGLEGFAGHVFAGAWEGEDGPFGATEWYRTCIAVTGACQLVRRDVFEALGGFDEEFTLMGSDVEFCLRVREAGYRVVYTPHARLRHLGAATRGDAIPPRDFHVSARHYRPILEAGDPYFNPNLSRWSTVPTLRGRGEESPLEFVKRVLERTAAPAPPRARSFLWARYSAEASAFAESWDFSSEDLEASRAVLDRHRGFVDIRSITWFIPRFDHAYYGGIHTILRVASYLKESKGVESRFVVIGDTAVEKTGSAIAEAFPGLRGAPVRSLWMEQELGEVAESDAAIATLWNTAYYVLKFNATKRKFYFVQDFEPLFYPAGSTFAQAEATYRFGFYGIANTVSLKEIYERDYGGIAEFFTPCVDTRRFAPAPPGGRAGEPWTVFFYGRPDHPRNGFELGAAALRQVKRRLGEKVRVVTAGAEWQPQEFGLAGHVENLGLLGYDETAALYRTCHVGLVMMFTRHPSYLPFELMASGCLVVSNPNPATAWFLQDGVNCLLAAPSATGIAEMVERALTDGEARDRITATALAQIRDRHSDWTAELERIYRFMCDPPRSGATGGTR